jgi:flagellar biosynthesis protein FlhF
MAMARQELGPDAMLLNSRTTPIEARHLGEYEVVFAMDPATEPVSQAAPAAAPPPDRLSHEVAELKRELEAMRRTICRSAFAPAHSASVSGDASEAYAILTGNDLPAELAREIVQSAEARAAASGRPFSAPGARVERTAFQRALVEEIGSRIVAQPELGCAERGPRIVALVGPPGCGKTTTLVKLAVNYGLACRRPVLLLSMDTYRVAAAEQLRSYSAILGVGFNVLETPGALAQAIEENRGKELILIDTPGFGFEDFQDAEPLAAFLGTRRDIDKQLVLPASMKPADLSRITDTYAAFQPTRLIFTRLDETASFGPILNETIRTSRPLSFFAAGQRIPEDLEAVTRERLIEMLLATRTGAALSAA